MDALKRSGVGGVDELAARLGHGRTLDVRAFRENRIGRSLEWDLSERCVSEFACPWANQVPSKNAAA